MVMSTWLAFDWKYSFSGKCGPKISQFKLKFGIDTN